MSTWEIQILNEDMHIVHHEYHTGWFQEEAEKIGREKCKELHEYTWQVLMIKKEV